MTIRLRRFPILTTALTALAVAVWAIPGAATALQYDRSALAAGELWRSATGHWTHWNADHLTWDLIVFAVFGALVERHSRHRFAAITAGAALAISASLWFAAPEFAQYRGLSGLDSALVAAFCAQLLRNAWHDRSLLQALVPAVALLGFFGKSYFELATGSTLFVAASPAFTAVPLAHLVGAAVGIMSIGSQITLLRKLPLRRSLRMLRPACHSTISVGTTRLPPPSRPSRPQAAYPVA